MFSSRNCIYLKHKLLLNCLINPDCTREILQEVQESRKKMKQLFKINYTLYQKWALFSLPPLARGSLWHSRVVSKAGSCWPSALLGLSAWESQLQFPVCSVAASSQHDSGLFWSYAIMLVSLNLVKTRLWWFVGLLFFFFFFLKLKWKGKMCALFFFLISRSFSGKQAALPFAMWLSHADLRCGLQCWGSVA